MRPTTRGWAAVAVVAGAAVVAAVSGARALNAVAAPLVVALAVGVVGVVRVEPPTVTIVPPRPGGPGQRRRLTLEVQGSGLARVSTPLPDGYDGDPLARTVDLPATIEHPVTARRRGVYDLQPVRVEQRDPLGLVARSVELTPTATAVVYPPRYDLGAGLAALVADDPAPERQEFDRLREYVPGDPLRNVHWKSSAKHDEYLVMEFDADRREGAVDIAASATDGAADGMASAAASVAALALRTGREVSLSLPSGTVPPGRGEEHRERIMRALAEAGPGSAARTAADISVRATAEGVTIAAGERSYDFESVTDGRAERTAERGRGDATGAGIGGHDGGEVPG